MRIDKWMWAVRMVKTRSLAGELCRAGHVTVNGEKAKASRELRLGDLVELQRGRWLKRYKVAQMIERRVGAKEAAACFEDLSPPPPPADDMSRLAAPAALREKGSGRPTKRDRRALAQLTKKFF